MRLYVCSKITNQPVYIDIVASSRYELARKLGNNYFFIGDGHQYHVSDVYATPSRNDTAGGALVGGLLGLVGGPIGIMLGGLTGGILGNQIEVEDSRKANTFNQSFVP